MMWKEEYAIGVEHIDKQHKGLFDVTERIMRILADGDSNRNRRACQEAIKYLKSYALNHFADEEEYQRSIGYERYHEHKQRHEQFAKSVVRMEQEMEAQDFSPESVQRFLGALTSWLVHHIMCSDQDIVGRALLEPEIKSKDPIVLLQHIFTQEGELLLGQAPNLVDSSYQGEFSGSESFVLIDCETLGGQNIRVLTALNAKLSMHLTKALLGDASQKEVQSFEGTALESLCSQVVLRFAELFYGDGQAEVTQVHHMRQWEITPAIPQKPPTCSLLFQSKYGEFVICLWTHG